MDEHLSLDMKCDPDLRSFLQNLDRPYELTMDNGFVIHMTTPQEDTSLVERIVAAYQKAQILHDQTDSPFWSDHFGGLKRPIHEALIRGNIAEVSTILRDPAGNELAYGFDHPCATWWSRQSIDPTGRQSRSLYDNLARLGEATGALRCYNRESPLDLESSPKTLDEIFAAIDAAIGVPVHFPTPFVREAGVPTSRGLLTYRAVQALYQATLVRRQLGNINRQSVLEIGAGMGRTAYYAVEQGCSDYTIIDLPITSVAQAYFLGRTVGPEAISLYGENRPNAKIRILPPETFFEGHEQYGLALNVDSLTELSRATAEQYLDSLATKAACLISINHERNGFSVRDLYASQPDWKTSRTPYWLRKGYVEEIITFPSPKVPEAGGQQPHSVVQSWWRRMGFSNA